MLYTLVFPKLAVVWFSGITRYAKMFVKWYISCNVAATFTVNCSEKSDKVLPAYSEIKRFYDTDNYHSRDNF